MENLLRMFEDFKQKKILIIGDVMIDKYILGNVERISPEAPVPVLHQKEEYYRLGGAANVGANISSLGAKSYILSIVGEDNNSNVMEKLFKEIKVSTLLLKDKERQTTIKTRVMTNKQQIVRIDTETTKNISSKTENEILKLYKKILPEIDAIILEDYNKGLLTKKLIKNLILLANEQNKIISVDPKYHNFFEYKNCTIFKPNNHEFQKNMKIEIKNEVEYKLYGKKLLKKMNCKYLVITRGEHGMLLFHKDKIINIPTYAKNVFDVSGAGDTTISMLTLAMTTNYGIETSIDLANHAAGAVCEKLGTVPVEKEDIIKSYKLYNEKK